MFANERLATAAAAKELAEAGERITAQRELAAVQAQVAFWLSAGCDIVLMGSCFPCATC